MNGNQGKKFNKLKSDLPLLFCSLGSGILGRKKVPRLRQLPFQNSNLKTGKYGTVS
jgi:hypothetical protein